MNYKILFFLIVSQYCEMLSAAAADEWNIDLERAELCLQGIAESPNEILDLGRSFLRVRVEIPTRSGTMEDKNFGVFVIERLFEHLPVIKQNILLLYQNVQIGRQKEEDFCVYLYNEFMKYRNPNLETSSGVVVQTIPIAPLSPSTPTSKGSSEIQINALHQLTEAEAPAGHNDDQVTPPMKGASPLFEITPITITSVSPSDNITPATPPTETANLVTPIASLTEAGAGPDEEKVRDVRKARRLDLRRRNLPCCTIL